ncbi:MAG: hypothetical protein O3B00_03570 [archaeon]|nr:hypothetical protein [archaeon]MDA1130561.1 hypothetical protein [archaeon]
MSRWIVLALFIIPSLFPMAIASVQSQARESNEIMSLYTPSEVIVHRGEMSEVFFTTHNIADGVQTFTANIENVSSDLSITGLPLNYTLVENHLQQLKFNVTADSSSEYGSAFITLNITTDMDSSFVVSQILVTIAPQSNLTFGVSGISTFTVEAGSRTSVAVNITNNAIFDDNITYDIYSSSTFNWGWTMNETAGNNAFETLVPGQLSYVFVWIDIPQVMDGAPLQGQGPLFTLKAVSGLDRALSQWSFNLIYDSFRNASIDFAEPDLELAPGEDGRLEITLRNTGNVDNRMNLTMQAIDENGDTLNGFSKSDRFENDGWTVALFNGLEDQFLAPNESRTIEIGFQSPVQYSGSINVRFFVFALGAYERTYSIDVGATIIRERAGEASLSTAGCHNLLPLQSCNSTIEVINTGNAIDYYSLELLSAPEFVSVSVPTTGIEIANTFSDEFPDITITASSDSIAFENGNVSIAVNFLNSERLQIINIPVKIAPVINWSFENVDEEIDSKGRLSIVMTLRNQGNAFDGLVVQLQSSHSTDMAFVPPSIAIIEEGVENPRSFEIFDIPVGANFTVIAWVEIPVDQQANGTIWINTTVRSKLSPEIKFIHTSSVDYKGIPWQPTVAEDEPIIDFAQIMSTTWEVLKAWSLVIMAIFVASMLLLKANMDRITRKTDEAIRSELYAQKNKSPEQVDDWMGKFSQRSQQPEIESALHVQKEQFEQAFTSRAGVSQPATQPMEPSLRDAATTVLESHDAANVKMGADELLGNIQQHGIAIPHQSNESLELKNSETEMTTRHDLQQILGESPVAESVSSVPLPKSIPSMPDLDDLDI